MRHISKKSPKGVSVLLHLINQSPQKILCLIHNTLNIPCLLLHNLVLYVRLVYLQNFHCPEKSVAYYIQFIKLLSHITNP